jgi:2-methylcitrate dehydratase PrpD
MTTSTKQPDAIAGTLSRFVNRLRLDAVPAEVSLRARHLMLDAIGCALAARREDFALSYAAAVQALDGDVEGARGVIGFDRRLPLRSAALLNGVMTHGLDYDDTHMTGIIHLSVSVLPTVLALASQRGASGADMLAAYIGGIEAGARISSVTRGGLHAHGFHPTGVVGAFAGALAAGRLLGLDEDGLVRAQGIALSLASGSLQFIEDGAWTKRMHPGWAAQAALTAATFAAHDILAPTAPYEGRYGFYRCYLGQEEHAKIDLSLATAHLDEATGSASAWETTNVAIKPFPVCHFIHASADAAIALHRSGLDASRIAEVQVRVPAGVVQSVCEPIAGKRAPASDYDAKFSLPYGVASGLLRGRLGLKELEPAAFNDPAARALMQRVSYVVDEDSTFPLHYTGEVHVTLDDGRTVSHRESVNRGHAERPLSNEEIRDKFFDNATLHFPRAHADAICDQVLALDRIADVRTLESLLARGPSID